MAERHAEGRGRPLAFGAVWLGQLVSIVGTSLTTFALGLTVYRIRGSATDFALIGFCAVVPRVVLSPVAGVLVDRTGRRRTMLTTSLGGGLLSLVLLGLAVSGRLDAWEVYLAAAVGGTLATFEWPAWSAATTLLVPRRQLGRAAGLVSVAQAASDIVGPIFAAALLVVARIEVILVLDVGSFVVAAATLALVRFPEPVAGPLTWRLVRRELLDGLRYIAARPALTRLVLFLMSVTFQWGVVAALLVPLVLGIGSPLELGTVISAAGLGALAGAAAMAITGGPRPRVRGLVVAEAASGLAFIAMGAGTSIGLVAAAAFAAHVTIPVIAGSNQVIWQERVPAALQGRVFAARQAIERLPAPFAYLVAGVLAERVFEPALGPAGSLAPALGPVFGVGDARGIGLLFALMGVVQLGIAVAGLASPLRRELDGAAPSGSVAA